MGQLSIPCGKAEWAFIEGWDETVDPLVQPSPGKRIWNMLRCSLPWMDNVFCWILMCTQISWDSYYRFGFSRFGWGLSAYMFLKLTGNTYDDPPWVGRLSGMFSCSPSVINAICVQYPLREFKGEHHTRGFGWTTQMLDRPVSQSRWWRWLLWLD